MQKPTNADFFSFLGRSVAENLRKTGDKDLAVIGTIRDLGRATKESVEDSKKEQKK